MGKNVAVRVFYRRDSPGCKVAEAVFLRGVADPRGWLEARLGPLAHFEIEPVGSGEVGGVAGNVVQPEKTGNTASPSASRSTLGRSPRGTDRD